MRDIGTLRFLVVEDNAFQRWLMSDMLEEMGARSVEAAADGRAALERLGQGLPIDVVVSDLDMPGIDGLSLIRQMAERRHEAELIVVSAQEPALLASVETMAREYRVNVLAVVQKPLTQTKLEATLRAPATAPARVAQAANHADVFTPEEIAKGLRYGEFEPYFQPKVAMPSRRTVGAEALVRWRHPGRGYIVPPAGFIDTIERYGLIDELTRVMARQSLAACRQWHAMGRDIGVSINLSALSLVERTLAERMTDLAAMSNLEPRYVTFEITESATVSDVGSKLENLSRMRMKGFKLSIDDFGTGYSSMHRLSRLPFTELKVDKVFVMRADAGGTGRAILESSLDLARKLGLTAVAEGVETQAEWDMLVALGCPIAQGYLIARPMSGQAFIEWLGKAEEDLA